LVVKHLGEACADNLRLKADVVELADALKLASEVGIKVADEVTRLKAEVERLKIDAYKKLSMRIEIDKLKARIEYLTNAGDFMADAINGDYNHELPCVKAWNAAKEGKPSV
jgi:hypothetical protein